MELAEFLEYWEQRIEKDLAPFGDPGTELAIARQANRILATWVSRSEPMTASFTASPERGEVAVNFDGRHLSYASFLASERMADLRGLARMILQSQRPGIYVRTRASLSGPAPAADSRDALDVLENLLHASEETGLTRIVFVTGDAGAGKTHVLQELVRNQATRYDQGQTDRLLLYVNAQGRALARFNEALATELQDLRSRLTYHAVSSLVRAGILVPVIDGFDELLGAAGYEDAFSSLAGFMEELGGLGQIVASARSAFYELEFVSRANTESFLGRQAWEIYPVHIEGWGDAEYESYLEKSLASANKREEEVRRIRERMCRMFVGENLSLQSKPFFVTTALDLALEGFELVGNGDLLGQLISALLERERTTKLLDRTTRPLLAKGQLLELVGTIAEEMWHQESRELDRKSLREIADLVLAAEDVNDSVRQMLVTRISTLAFFVPVAGAMRVAFEHEMFFGYFLSSSFAKALVGSSAILRGLLGRSVLPDEVGNRVARDRISQPPDLHLALGQLREACRIEDRRSGRVRENAGVLAAAILQRGSKAFGVVSKAELEGMFFPGLDFGGVRLENARLSNVTFQRTDFTNLRVTNSRGHAVCLLEVVIDPASTRLEIESIDVDAAVYGLRVRREHGIEPVYLPQEMRIALRACGLPIPEDGQPLERQVAPEMVELVEKLVRAFGRANPICTADDTMRHIFLDRSWNPLEEVLLAHGLLSTERRSARGPRKRFLRRQFLPDQLMAGLNVRASVPSEVRNFWSDLEQRFPLSE